MSNSIEKPKETGQGQSTCSDLLESDITSDPRLLEIDKRNIILNQRLDELLVLVQQLVEQVAETKQTVGQLLRQKHPDGK